MKIRGLLALLLSVAVMSSCDGLQDIISGSVPGTEDTGDTGDTGDTDDGDTGDDGDAGNDGGTDEQGTVTIASITTDGTYKVQGTVLAVGDDAYILADETAPILVYGSNHGRTLMEVVKAEGSVYRYNGYNTNVFQMETTSVEVVSTGAQWEYSPTRLDAAAFDALVGKTATCADITFEGTLTIDRTYVNVRPEGAGKTSSFKYVSASDYTALDGQKVVVSAFVTGTYNYLYMFPYKVEVKQPSWMVCGTHDGWGNGTEMEKKGEYWVAYNLRFPAGTENEMKLRLGQNWGGDEFGAADTGIVLSADTFCSVVSADGGNIPVMAGTYDIWLDIAEEKLYLMTPGKDISEAVEASGTAPEPGQPEVPEPEEPGTEEGITEIVAITTAGTYTIKGTVVAVGSQAYIVSDDTDAIMIYGSGHGRSVGDVVKITGEAYRHNDAATNVFQMKDVVPEVLSTGATWNYNPMQVNASILDSNVGATAKCYEVEFTGVLVRSGNYLNFSVAGATKKASFSYVDTSLYSDIADGASVHVKGFIVGTNGYLKVLPYFTEVVEGSSGGDDPMIPSDSDPRGKKWMELPAMSDTSLDYYYHSFPLNGSTYRNYSFGWDDSNKVALWVAYPLCSFYTASYDGENHRHEEYFIKDPLLGDASPRPGGGWAGDYDRGHQIPSADRQCSELANGQTYYGTNMTAQSNPLNGGPWANLEGAVRDFAKSSSDTTYVVTGCYVGDSVEWSTDSDGMRIKVPTAYFKAILVLKNGNWTGGAYWTPHVGYASSYTSWATSIDWLEQKTGLDFFVNLPDKIGASAAAEIEAATSGSAKWWN